VLERRARQSLVSETAVADGLQLHSEHCIPSTAINQLEFWQRDTWDPRTIDRELGFAQGAGMNAMRVFLHNLVWETEGDAFLARIDQFLGIASRHGIRTMFVPFDDVWNPNPHPGKQPKPVPGVHNSGWVQAPGPKRVQNPTEWPKLQQYVQAVIGHFAHDNRVLVWDLYNEPGNGLDNNQSGMRSMPFLKAVFGWAREVEPSQPVSVGIWGEYFEIDQYAYEHADILTAHTYTQAPETAQMVRDLNLSRRPLIVTEWMARTIGSRIATHLEIFRRWNTGALCWGLVAGKTNTMWPWGSKPGTPEPKVWFHDLFHPDGTPFDPAEIALMRKLTAAARAARAK
jgi:hypothetical protein